MRPPFHLGLLGVGELHGDLELGGGVGVGVPGDHLRGGAGERKDRKRRKEPKDVTKKLDFACRIKNSDGMLIRWEEVPARL